MNSTLQQTTDPSYSVLQIYSVLGLNHLKYFENCTKIQAVLAMGGVRMNVIDRILDEWNADLPRISNDGAM